MDVAEIENLLVLDVKEIKLTVDKSIPIQQLSGEDTLLGTVDIFGTPHHFQAIRVERDADGILRGTNDPHNRLDDIYGVYDAPPKTTTLLDLPGEWIILIHPHGE